MDKKILKGNKMIAEFMGFKGATGYYLPYGENKNKPMEYHSSWDWLMPVVEKIEGLGYRFKQCRRRVEIIEDSPTSTSLVITKEETKILSAWKAVIQFIQWYTNQTPKQ